MLKNLKILFVEDDNNTRNFISLLLSSAVKEIITAQDGVEGLEKYEKYNPDIVLTDITMPKMDGFTMSKKIKEINPNQIIIVMSAHDKEENINISKEIGIREFISKPVDVEYLKSILINCI